MNDTFKRVASYLSAELHDRPIDPTQTTISPSPFVSISRETGAGGHWVGLLLLEHLNRNKLDPPWDLLDAELFQHLLNDEKLDVPLNSLIEERFYSPIEEAFHQLLSNAAPQEVITHKIFRIMRLMARRGRVILLGRGGVCATSDLPGGLHVRLIAPLTMRIERMKALLEATEEEAIRTIAEQDAARGQLVHSYFNRQIADPLLYHTIWNTSKVSPSDIVSIMTRMIMEKSRDLIHSC